ncbi:hypothetical protein [Methylobacterium brachythecii]|uniref:Uncharacterized protein n=1 Tax=Methylobacterium brachythecii TaxID=1176177 RepID=A0A7W6F9K8_9HYPH|nr:hypothetical protein [Methylobacterium brachythecii]MBB3905569.1 hypothetical protein [Methylobacterium brachythecii]GLS46556.1 hypothetical protein GCM10007884_45500 [Methylobacterium brachythecii]
MTDDRYDETPADAFDCYVAEAERRLPARTSPERWGASTIILVVVEVGIVVVVRVWWLR